MTKENLLKQNRNEILWHLINSGLAGGLVFLGSIADGHLTIMGVIVSFVAAGAVAISKFKAYWESEEKEYCDKTAIKVFTFIG